MPYKDPTKKKAFYDRYYSEHREEGKRKSRNRREKIKERFRAYKESKGCQDCNGKFPYYVLQFDHRENSSKTGDVSRLIKSAREEIAWKEVEKCDVVCANCHSVRTFKRMAPSSTG